MSDLLKLGYSGTRASQHSLSTTGHNISNVNTPGYSRQEAVQATSDPYTKGGLQFGMGATTETIRRITDQFITQQVRTDTSLAKEQETILDYAKQLDNLLADPNSSPGQAINEFFSAVESLNDEPNSQPLRELVLSEADTLATRFNLAGERFDSVNDSINTQLETTLQQVNRLASTVASLNEEIVMASARGSGNPPNDLMDMREEKLRELSEYVSVKSTTAADGTFNVIIGDGFPLVVGGESYSLKADQGKSVPGQLDVYYEGQDGDKLISDEITGGELGGLLTFREDILTPATNQLGRLALTISQTFNAQHQLGMDLNNELGGNFFRNVNETELMSGRVAQHAGNNTSTNISLGLQIDDPQALTDKNYQLTAITGGASATFSLKDGDGNVVRFADDSTTPTTYKTVATLSDLKSGNISVDGFSLILTEPTAADRVYAGDQFELMPTDSAASELRREINNANEIALASPLRVETSLNNDGSGEVADYEVTATYPSSATAPATSPNPDAGTDYAFIDQTTNTLRMYTAGSVQDLPNGLDIAFTSNTDYEIRDPDTGTVLATGTFTPGQRQNVIPSDWGFQVEIGGKPSGDNTVTPVQEDVFTLSFNTDGEGDNGNGMTLSQLQSDKILDGGQISYQDGYAKITEFVGIQTAEAQVNAESGNAILEQTKLLREQTSGVNLDEEAANLVKFQQAYNASAQLISVAQKAFDTLIAAVGR